MHLATKRLVPIKSFRNTEFYGGSFSEASIRWLIFNEKTNGFSRCVKRIGKKILIDLDEFEAWINSNGEKK